MIKINTPKQEPNRPIFKLKINEIVFEWPNQYINGLEIRRLGQIAEDAELFLAVHHHKEELTIENSTEVDLGRSGIEHFFTKKNDQKKLVEIHINEVKYDVEKGLIPVNELKTLGKIPPEHELEQLIDGKLTPLADDASVRIKGGEVFFSHVRDGSSS